MATNLHRAGFFFALFAHEANAVPLTREVAASPVRSQRDVRSYDQQSPWDSVAESVFGQVAQNKVEQVRASKAVSSRKRVVIGLAAEKTIASYTKSFVKSLRNSGYDGDIILGVSDSTGQALKQFYADHKVKTASVALHKCSAEPRFNCGDITMGGKTVEASLNLARFQFYKNTLAGYTGDDLIMLTDVRDVYFQRDPFPVLQERLDQGKDLFMMEEETEAFNNTIGWESPKKWNFNRGWIWSCWGKAAMELLKEKIVTCSGTTMGTGDGMTRYLDVTMKEIVDRVDHKDKKNCPGWVNKECDCASGGIDQGYHNYLYHSGKFGSTTTSFQNGRGPVYTVGMVCSSPARDDPNALKLDEHGMVSQVGEKAFAVHQANRCTRPHGWLND